MSDLRDRIAKAVRETAHADWFDTSSPYAVADVVLAIVEDHISDGLAPAWDEGYEEAVDDYGCDIPFPDRAHRSNPYRSPAVAS